MAARCHQSSRPRLSPAYFLAGSPVVSTSMSCTESSGSTAHAELAGPLHAAKHVVLRAPAGSREPSPSRSTASSGRRRCAAAASSGKAAAPEPSGGSSASAACPAAAQRCRSRLPEPLWQLAPRYRRPPPILGHCRGRAERRARRCGAGSGFYSASGTISPIYSRSSRLLNNIYCPGITPGLAPLYSSSTIYKCIKNHPRAVPMLN